MKTIEVVAAIICKDDKIFATQRGRIVYKELFEEIQKIKPPEGGFKWAVSIKPYPTRDSTRIAKTDVLTVQRYEV